MCRLRSAKKGAGEKLVSLLARVEALVSSVASGLRSSAGIQRLPGTKKPSWKLGFWNGEGGIRTHGAREDTLVFKTRAINHSTTSPGAYKIKCRNKFYHFSGHSIFLDPYGSDSYSVDK